MIAAGILHDLAAVHPLDGLDLEGNRINPALRFTRPFLQHSLPLLRLTVTELPCLNYGVHSSAFYLTLLLMQINYLQLNL